MKKFSVMFQLFSVVARWLGGSAHLLTCSARLGIGSARLGGSAHKLHAHAHAPRNKATACRLVGLSACRLVGLSACRLAGLLSCPCEDSERPDRRTYLRSVPSGRASGCHSNDRRGRSDRAGARKGAQPHSTSTMATAVWCADRQAIHDLRREKNKYRKYLFITIRYRFFLASRFIIATPFRGARTIAGSG